MKHIKNRYAVRTGSDMQYLHITVWTVTSSDRSSFYLKHEQCIYINIKPTYETDLFIATLRR